MALFWKKKKLLCLWSFRSHNHDLYTILTDLIQLLPKIKSRCTHGICLKCPPQCACWQLYWIICNNYKNYILKNKIKTQHFHFYIIDYQKIKLEQWQFTYTIFSLCWRREREREEEDLPFKSNEHFDSLVYHMPSCQRMKNSTRLNRFFFIQSVLIRSRKSVAKIYSIWRQNLFDSECACMLCIYIVLVFFLSLSLCIGYCIWIMESCDLYANNTKSYHGER